MDYKELLRKYIKHVIECESTDFVKYMETIPWEQDDKLLAQDKDSQQILWTDQEIDAIVELSGFDERK